MAAAASKTDEVLASARRDLEAQLAIVREEIARLTAEELALTHAVTSLDGGNPATSSDGRTSKRAVPSRSDKRQATKSATRKASPSRRRRPRGASKPTADRVKELQGALAGGPKSRSDLAGALKVSPARVQQLLAELGSSVSSQPNPEQRQGKLWSLKGGGNGGGPGSSRAKRNARNADGASTHQSSARKGAAAK